MEVAWVLLHSSLVDIVGHNLGHIEAHKQGQVVVVVLVEEGRGNSLVCIVVHN